MNKQIERALKRIITRVIAFSLCCSAMSPIDISAIYIDNDDSFGYVNANQGYETYWTSSAYFRGDARLQTTGDSNKCYAWKFPVTSYPTSNYKINVDFYAYLNDVSFNDPGARYIATTYFYTSEVVVLNQDSATVGWNYLGYKSLTPLYSSNVKLTGIEIKTQTLSYSYNTAADGVRIDYTIQNNGG